MMMGRRAMWLRRMMNEEEDEEEEYDEEWHEHLSTG
jgi:hypothetical protein